MQAWRMVCELFNNSFADLPRLIEIAGKIAEEKREKKEDTWKTRRGKEIKYLRRMSKALLNRSRFKLSLQKMGRLIKRNKTFSVEVGRNKPI